MTKFRSIIRDDHHWLAVELADARMIFLHPMARVGDCHRPGQKLSNNITK